MANRITPANVNATLEITFINEDEKYWCAYESGKAHIFQSEKNGRRHVFTGTAKECWIFAQGMFANRH